jgi:endonuclease I
MKKHLLGLFCLITSTLWAQLAPVPSPNYSFDGPLPPGWTSQLLLGSGTATTYTSGGSAYTIPSCRLDNTGEFVAIHFADQPGAVSYWIKGNVGGTTTVFIGTFSIQESVDGQTWTNMRTFTGTQLSASQYAQYSDVPLAASRWVRFFFTDKQPGANVGLDDISVGNPVVPGPALKVKEGNRIVNNNDYVVSNSTIGTATSLSLTLRNIGNTNALVVQSLTISGPSAAEFSVASQPSSVAALDSGIVTISFTPAQSGTRNASLSIPTNDPNFPVFTVNLYGVGGALASEPVAQPSGLNFTDVKSYRFKGTFSPPNPLTDAFGGVLIVRGNGQVPNTPPTDGKVYQRGDTVGNFKVVFSGSMSEFIPIGIVANSTYHFKVYSYNGPGIFRNYKTDSPLTGNVTTLPNMIPSGEYNSINPTATSFISDLHALVNPHTSLFYSSYASTVGERFESRDTSGGRRAITCVYSGYTRAYRGPFTFSIADTGFSREHTYCHSWMPSYPADGGTGGTEKPEYNDQHHLFPAKFTQVNEARSNNPLGEAATITSQFMDAILGKDANNVTVFEPREQHKGDAARALFYMCIAYNSVNNSTWKLPPGTNPTTVVVQNQNILKQWHFQDPPSSWEIARNDYLDSLQGNRNPFIDHPEYVCYIDFSTMTYITGAQAPCNDVGLNAASVPYQVILAPNPAEQFTTLYYTAPKNERLQMMLTNIEGKSVWENIVVAAGGIQQRFDLSLLGIAPGIYQLSLVGSKGVVKEKLVVTAP